MTDKLEALATSFAAEESGPSPEEEQQQQADQAQAEAKASQVAVIVEKLAAGLLRAARAMIAHRIPEIREEWPDEILLEPAKHVAPVLQKRAAGLLAHAEKYPEEAMLVISMLPLALGAVAALEKHQANQTQMLQPGQDGVHVPEGGQ
jgi:hypothetical protein